MKGFLINLGVNWIIGALKSDKKGLKEKVIDGLKRIPDDVLEKGLTENKK